MTNSEFSNEFDVLTASFTSDNSIAFDEYEKSVFLTKAQELIVVELYTGRNNTLSSFEETEELRSYLRNLIKEASLTGLDNKYSLPSDLLFIIYEEASITGNNLKDCETSRYIEVVPVPYDSLHRVKDNPFRGPNKRRVIRTDILDNKVLLLTDYTILDYKIKYIKRPSPIVLTELEDDLTITGDGTQCELIEILHRPILERAVALALSTRLAK